MAVKKTKTKEPVPRAATRKWCKVTVVVGPGGYALYVNDLRVAGPKPLGGGRAVCDLRPLVSDVKAALRGPKA
jgi:hypothetical protein